MVSVMNQSISQGNACEQDLHIYREINNILPSIETVIKEIKALDKSFKENSQLQSTEILFERLIRPEDPIQLYVFQKNLIEFLSSLSFFLNSISTLPELSLEQQDRLMVSLENLVKSQVRITDLTKS